MGRGDVYKRICLRNLKERPRKRCEDNIKIDLKGIRWEGVD
jgi:hypothetical protein